MRFSFGFRKGSSRCFWPKQKRRLCFLSIVRVSYKNAVMTRVLIDTTIKLVDEFGRYARFLDARYDHTTRGEAPYETDLGLAKHDLNVLHSNATHVFGGDIEGRTESSTDSVRRPLYFTAQFYNSMVTYGLGDHLRKRPSSDRYKNEGFPACAFNDRLFLPGRRQTQTLHVPTHSVCRPTPVAVVTQTFFFRNGELGKTYNSLAMPTTLNVRTIS